MNGRPPSRTIYSLSEWYILTKTTPLGRVKAPTVNAPAREPLRFVTGGIEADPTLTRAQIMANMTETGRGGFIRGLRSGDPDLVL